MDRQPTVNDRREIAYDFVRSIPAGKVLSYGQVGQLTEVPIRAREVGHFMRTSWGVEIPWWRVVASDGRMATAKLDPRLAAEQRHHLEEEGVMFKNDKVPREFFWDGEH